MRPVYAVSGGVSKFAKARPDKTLRAVIEEAVEYAISDITYLHSYGQDSPWFAGLASKRSLASRDRHSGYTYANPRGHDMYPGDETKWVDITDVPAHVHAFTVCYFGSEEFLPDTPYVLARIEFEGVNTLPLTRSMGVDPASPSLEWIGIEVTPHFLRNSKFKPTDVYFSPSAQ